MYYIGVIGRAQFQMIINIYNGRGTLIGFFTENRERVGQVKLIIIK